MGLNIAYPALLGATFLGGASGLVIKALPYSGLAVTAFRMGVPFLFFLPLMIRRKLIFGPAANRKQLWTGSLLNAVRMILYIFAYKLTSLGNAVVLLYLWPLFALILHSLQRKEKPRGREIGLLILALSGVVLMNLQKGFSFSSRDLAGSLCMILSAFLFSITMLIFKDALKERSEGDILYFQNAIGALAYLPFLLTELSAYSAGDFVMGLGYGLFVGVVGFGLFFVAMKRLPLFQYSALTYAEVVFGVILGSAVLNEGMSWSKGAGIIFILCSSVLSRFASSEKE